MANPFHGDYSPGKFFVIITYITLKNETVQIVSWFLLSMRIISTPPKDVENQLQRRYYSIKWSKTLMRRLAM